MKIQEISPSNEFDLLFYKLQNQIEDLFCYCNDFLGQLSGMIGEYKESIEFIQHSIDIMTKSSNQGNIRKLLDEDDIIILREKVKIIELLFHSKENLQSRNNQEKRQFNHSLWQ